MGVWDDWKARWLGRAATEGAKRAAREVADRVGAFGEEFLSDAEKQLAEAEARRAGRDALPSVHPDVSLPEPPPPAEPEPGAARRERERREAAAHDELARMKAELRRKVTDHEER